jgi:hypothetical protein
MAGRRIPSARAVEVTPGVVKSRAAHAPQPSGSERFPVASAVPPFPRSHGLGKQYPCHASAGPSRSEANSQSSAPLAAGSGPPRLILAKRNRRWRLIAAAVPATQDARKTAPPLDFWAQSYELRYGPPRRVCRTSAPPPRAEAQARYRMSQKCREATSAIQRSPLHLLNPQTRREYGRPSH